MSIVSKPANKKIIETFLQHDADNTLTWVETHGLIAAMAVGPAAPEGWQELCYAGDAPLPADVVTALEKQRLLLASRIAEEEGLQPPCLLDTYSEDDRHALTSWCMGLLRVM